MPYHIIYRLPSDLSQPYFEIIDAISGDKVQTPEPLTSPSMVAKFMTYTLYHLNPVTSTGEEIVKRFDRWYATAQEAMKHPGSETRIVAAEGEPAPTTPGNPTLPEGWKQRSETIWQKETPGYLLDVQLYNGGYYATVTETGGIIGKRHIDNTSYRSLSEAITAATRSMIRLSSAETKAKMKESMEKIYGSPVGVAGQVPEDASIVAMKKMLTYTPYSLPSGETGLIAYIGDNVQFVVYKRGQMVHTDVVVNGVKRALGNYRLQEWAMYQAPYFWYQKNRSQVRFKGKEEKKPETNYGSSYVPGSGKLF